MQATHTDKLLRNRELCRPLMKARSKPKAIPDGNAQSPEAAGLEFELVLRNGERLRNLVYAHHLMRR